MRLCLIKLINSALICLAILVLIPISAFGQHTDLPSGLPKNLSDNSAYEPCLGTFLGQSPPRCPWYVQTDVMALKRDAGRSLPVAAKTLPVPIVPELWDRVAFSTGDLDSPFRIGGKLVVGHTLGDSRWQIDGTYFALDSWDSSASIRDTSINNQGVSGNLFSPFSNFGGQPAPGEDYSPQYGYDYNNYVSVREVSQLQNGELNLRYLMPMPHECLTAKFIVGLRYMSINEKLDYDSESNVSNIGVPGFVSTTQLLTTTTNSLLGPQLGGEFYFYTYPNCWIDVGIKGAVCNNQSGQRTSGMRPADISWDDINNGSRNTTSFVGDLDVSLVWQLTSHLTTRIGYQALWVTDVAMARRNFSQPASGLENGTSFLDTTGDVVYHGPHIGLEYSW